MNIFPKRYGVRIHGVGISVSTEDEPVIGFYTTRRVFSRNPDSAIEKARNLVLSDWLIGEYAQINNGSLPRLTIDAVFEMRLHSIITQPGPGAGHTFYDRED